MNQSKTMVMVVGMTMVALATGPAAAQEQGAAAAPAARAEPRHSINGNPMGFLIGDYALNYEYLAGSHGLVAEAGYAHHGDDSASVTSYGVGAGWRWHWQGRQNSWFLGAMVRFAGGTAEASGGGDTPMRYDLTLKEVALTFNVGKRWQWASGVNLTARVGAGRAKRWVSTTSTDPDAQAAVDDVQDLLDFLPIAFDSELSLGYSF